MFNFYRLFLNLCHVLYFMKTFTYRCYILCKNLWRLYLGASSKVYPHEIEKDSDSIGKIPIHIGILLLEETISYHDIAALVLWCVVVGISHITLYDRKGQIKTNSAILKREILERRKDLLGNDSSNRYKYSIDFHIDRNDNNNLGKNCKIKITSESDGKTSLVQVTRNIAKSVACNTMKIEDVEPITVDHILKDDINTPDPDLLVQFGATHSLMGFLPWHIRLSEILFFPSHHNIDYQDFMSLLRSYSNKEQRFGK